jgi:hypothetical protein
MAIVMVPVMMMAVMMMPAANRERKAALGLGHPDRIRQAKNHRP